MISALALVRRSRNAACELLTSIFGVASMVMSGVRRCQVLWIAIAAGVLVAVERARCPLVQVRELLAELAEVIRAWRQVRQLLRRGRRGGERRRPRPVSRSGPSSAR